VPGIGNFIRRIGRPTKIPLGGFGVNAAGRSGAARAIAVSADIAPAR